ncbi:DUF4386 domain-containing protein [Paenibacillus sp. HWE-109]|uniref:DUF4386 domain-containing protein n=1 Tax=Paenibacillus sp. HWE-109 TaxID=1306526 RepID=UPI001EDF3975|nr:DUF4386 domain-containing protein [Paenibacillus sp. HWE-109]UKS24231.1 DUF4386 domain-containing protein [Paenibacillus sp. HWE-109]
MTANRKSAFIVGVLFILATVTSIIGLILYDPILNGPNSLVTGSEHANQVILGALLELILACSVVGTSITLFPFLKKQNESLALGYVCFRLLEAAIIIVGVISVLSLLTLSQEFVKISTPNTASFQTSGILLKAVHDWTFMLGPNFMLAVNTMMCSYLLYKSKLVPRFISIMGLAGATLIFIATLLEMFGIILQLSTWGAILAVPVFAYEMILAVWLIVKGFNSTSHAS